MKHSIEDKYRKLTDIEHVLARSSMYVGSTEPHTGNHHIFDGDNIELKKVTYNPAFLKIFDEILSNSVDEHRKTKSLNEIKVTFNLDSGEIKVWDNGGIPVKRHSTHKEWIPEMIFANLKAGSSFDDSKDRDTAGTNGVGATLTNIFSTKFIIKTCDGTDRFEQTFTNNMNKRSTAKISKSTKNFTEISYTPDLPRFQMKKIDDISYKILYKRCADAAACNPRLKIKVSTVKDGHSTSKDVKFRKFEDYIKLYVNDEYFYEDSKDWRIGFAKSQDGFNNISFVNSVHTKEGGTHVDYITNQLISHLRDMIKNKHKVDVKPNDIRNHLYVFIDCMVVNPAFSSQTKEKLITETRKFKTSHDVTESIAKRIFKSEIIQSVLDWVERKHAADERAELRKLNKSLDRGRVGKLIDAQKKGDRSKCILGVYEGMCIDEDTEIIVMRGGLISNIKIKNININDCVISCDNKIEEVYQVSKKIEKSKTIKLTDGSHIKLSENHRLFIYNSNTETFEYIKVKNININVHKIVKNKLCNIDSFNLIVKNELILDKYNLILDNGEIIVSSHDTKICVFDKLEHSFSMVPAEDIREDLHVFIGFTKI